MGADGLVGRGGVIAAGTVGGVGWRAVVTGGTCASFTVDFAKGGTLSFGCADASRTVSGTDAANPVTFIGTSSDGTNYASYGQVSGQVAYLIVTFTDGQQLKLIPVIAGGVRYFAWVAPLSMTVASVVVHLGGPYSTGGQTEIAVPFDLPGQIPLFGLTQKPGQSAPPRATKVMAGGTTAGMGSWTVRADEGPWGTCFDADVQPSRVECVPIARLATTAVLGDWNVTAPDSLVFGSAAPGVALVRVTFHGGATVTARPVRVGNEDLFAVAIAGYGEVVRWTAYDASGKQVGTGTVPPGSLPA